MLSSLQKLLRPIARFCIRRSLHVQDLLDAAKVALIHEGQRELRLRGEEPNVSKLAAMTGLHRRDVTRLFSNETQVEHPRGLVSRVIGCWLNAEQFCSTPGNPAPLTIGEGERSFGNLVNSVSKDLHPGTILAEMERVGVIERRDDSVVLIRQAHIIRGDGELAFKHAAADMNDLLSAVESNIFGNERALHATTCYDNIPAESAQELREWLLKEGARIHKEARGFLSKFDRDLSPGNKEAGGVRMRVVLGTFGLVERYEEEAK